MNPGAAAVIAALSAAAAEFVFYIEPYRFNGWPSHVKQWSYWIPVAIGMLLAGGVGFLFANDQEIRWYVAVNLGVSWRLIVTEAAKRSPEPRATDVN
jgi:hypothetical protein